MMRTGAALAVSLALLAGCGGHANVQVNSIGAPVPGGTTVNVQGRTTLGTLLSIILLAGIAYEGERAMPRSAPVPFDAPMPRYDYVPELDPTRRVVVQDCTRPIEDWSANLKCR